MKIAFQGELGAYGHEACLSARPDHEPLPCVTFAETINTVRKGRADLGMIAVENSTFGRVPDTHRLISESKLYVVDEIFVRVHINLLGPKGAHLRDVTAAHGHQVILPQCSNFLRKHNIKAVINSDNARAAREAAEAKDPTHAALASQLAAEIYNLEVLARHIEDCDQNTTRFLVVCRQRAQSSDFL